MGKSLREKAVMAVIGVIILYAIAAGLWFMSVEASWKKAAKAYNKAKETYAKEEQLIAEKREWEDRYATEKALMPTFEVGKTTDTTWGRKLDQMAATNHVFISRSEPGEEKVVGEVLELPIETSWEGSLEALVHLMHELENTTEGMFSITRLEFKPSSKKGYLKGGFTLNCAYMRD